MPICARLNRHYARCAVDRQPQPQPQPQPHSTTRSPRKVHVHIHVCSCMHVLFHSPWDEKAQSSKLVRCGPRVMSSLLPYMYAHMYACMYLHDMLWSLIQHDSDMQAHTTLVLILVLGHHRCRDIPPSGIRDISRLPFPCRLQTSTSTI